MFLFSVINWFFEIIKWQILANKIRKISFKDALIQTLSSFTVSMITPNRIGEYGFKLFFFKSLDVKKIIALQSIQSFSQLFATLFFGLMGCLYFKYYQLSFVILICFLLKLIVKKLSFLPKKIALYVAKIRLLVEDVYQSVLILSICRYLIFSTQYMILLYWFDVENNFFELYFTLTLMYLFSSILPTLQFFDVLIKGTVGVFVFDKINVPAATILQVSIIMWFFNMLLPYILGLYYWIKFKPSWK
jgi:hypothetical protein